MKQFNRCHLLFIKKYLLYVETYPRFSLPPPRLVAVLLLLVGRMQNVPNGKHERSDCPLRNPWNLRETKTSARKIHVIHEIRGNLKYFISL